MWRSTGQSLGGKGGPGAQGHHQPRGCARETGEQPGSECRARYPCPGYRVTGQRGSPLTTEQGRVANLREEDVDPSTLPAVLEQEDEAM
eukprot:4568170-Amphidinium_carterae.1